MEATRANLSTDERFTEDGAKEQFRNYVLSAAVPVFHRGCRAIQQAAQQLAEKRAKLHPPRPPADAAGAIAMMEIRTWFAGPAPGGARRDHHIIARRKSQAIWKRRRN